MQQREWLPCAIQLRAPFDHKAHPLIKPNRLLILLVNINQPRAKLTESILQQPASYSPPAPYRVNEKHLNFVALDSDEAHNQACFITYTG